ncbi:low-density lipoprotein receptor class A domain-containing protein 2 isoform X1 [Sphaerodactylus townsendi]|uniref:low-density lipoprotein receptor class A domain-containing protein 2 isoform X1 n=1 Tax=Sphaerodactylus townsendi TaxID=933632 RepID=UPI002025D4F7|nr:low-density lipoprotein receptor class A domain-containing protein 2 isoform X1 [Sphaerodactylus townsendi]
MGPVGAAFAWQGSPGGGFAPQVLGLSSPTVSLVDFCGQTLQGDGMVLTSHQDSRRYYFVVSGTDCKLTLQAASARDKVQFRFRFFLVYSMLPEWSSSPPSGHEEHLPQGSPKPRREQEAPKPCATGSFVQLYDGRGHTAEPLGPPLCGKNIPRPVLSTGSFLTLRLVTRGQQPRVDFVGDFTSLRTGVNASACRTGLYFPCRNGKCIPHSLVCDSSNVDNCGDGTDQAARPPARCKALLPVKVSATVPALPRQVTRAGLQESLRPPAKTAAWGKADEPWPLFASLAAVFGAALLYWCCWNPGFFLWRVGACRFLPGCNGPCAACHLCMQSCARGKPAKVTPDAATELPV